MPTIPAEEVEITIRDGFWQLIPTENTLSTRPVFQVVRGGGVMEYTPAFGQAHKLPGTVISVEYIRAVVIGYDEKTRRWLLGFHVGRSDTEESRWLELVRWPAGDNTLYSAAAQQAGRELAEHIGCPLKIFGAKKLTRPLTDPNVHGRVTGPLVPHKREDIGPQQVKLMAQAIDLPIQYPNMWLGQARNSVTLRLAKEATMKKGSVAPSFNQCVIDPEQGAVRLMPPTGLLGSFLSGQQGRMIRTADVRNIELRHSIIRRAITQEDNSDVITEKTQITHTWDIYLTLSDESVLLAQTNHITSSDLLQQRATSTNKFSVNSSAGIEYLRRHQEDQEAYDVANNWADAAAVIIASTLGVRLVKTEVEEGPG
jgi:hypothetical protein